MPQTIHIFLKDVRRSWYYIAVVVAFTAMLAVMTPRSLPLHGIMSTDRTVDVLHFLLPMTWWFTIAHVIHGDTPVGDRQFWVTRPYSWMSLFGAKLLFGVVFLTVPMLIADVIILSSDGFPPAPLAGGLLLRQLSLFGMPMLPAFVLAALTRNTREFIMACFLIVVVFLLLILTSSQSYHFEATPIKTAPKTWLEDWIGPFLYGLGALALILWQYARRHTLAARAVLIVAVAFLVLMPDWPSHADAFAPPKHPAPVAYPEVAVVYQPERGPRVDPTVAGGAFMSMSTSTSPRSKVQVAIPIGVAGRGRELVDISLSDVKVEPASGPVWRPTGSDSVQAVTRDGVDWMELNLDPAALQSLSTGPVKLRAVFGVVVYEKQTSVRLSAYSGWTPVPGFGQVTIPDFPRFSNFPLPIYVAWRMPLADPMKRLIYTLHDPDSGMDYHGERHGIYPAVSESMQISPVASSADVLTQVQQPTRRINRLSKNAAGEFTVERPVTQVRRDLEIPAIQLKTYAEGEFKSSGQ